MTRRLTSSVLLLLPALAVSSCMLGPNYQRPAVTPAPAYRDVTVTPGAGAVHRRHALGRAVQGTRAVGAGPRGPRPQPRTAGRAVPRRGVPGARGAVARGPQAVRRRPGDHRRRAHRGRSSTTPTPRGCSSTGRSTSSGACVAGPRRRRRRLLATEWGTRAVMTSVVTDVAQLYVTLRALDEQLAITQAHGFVARGVARPGQEARRGRRRLRRGRRAGHQPGGRDACRPAADRIADPAGRERAVGARRPRARQRSRAPRDRSTMPIAARRPGGPAVAVARAASRHRPGRAAAARGRGADRRRGRQQDPGAAHRPHQHVRPLRARTSATTSAAGRRPRTCSRSVRSSTSRCTTAGRGRRASRSPRRRPSRRPWPTRARSCSPCARSPTRWPRSTRCASRSSRTRRASRRRRSTCG